MQACHWKAHNIFINIYLKELTWSDDNNMYLGPVVSAQQVLDPSPQTSHPQTEKNGAYLLQPSLHESNFSFWYRFTSQDVMDKVILYFWFIKYNMH